MSTLKTPLYWWGTCACASLRIFVSLGGRDATAVIKLFSRHSLFLCFVWIIAIADKDASHNPRSGCERVPLWPTWLELCSHPQQRENHPPEETRKKIPVHRPLSTALLSSGSHPPCHMGLKCWCPCPVGTYSVRSVCWIYLPDSTALPVSLHPGLISVDSSSWREKSR